MSNELFFLLVLTPIAGGVLLLATRPLFGHERRLVPLRAFRAAVSAPILAGLAAGAIVGLLWGGLGTIYMATRPDTGEFPAALVVGMFAVSFLFGLVCASLALPTIGVLKSDVDIIRGVIKPAPKPAATCDGRPHFRCAGCGYSTFRFEEIGDGWYRAFAIDDQHQPSVIISETQEAPGAHRSARAQSWSGPTRYYVRCVRCSREIEFGWSDVKRDGRVLPVEASCFDPHIAWPEERYRGRWKTRGWLSE